MPAGIRGPAGGGLLGLGRSRGRVRLGLGAGPSQVLARLAQGCLGAPDRRPSPYCLTQKGGKFKGTRGAGEKGGSQRENNRHWRRVLGETGRSALLNALHRDCDGVVGKVGMVLRYYLRSFS